MPNIINAISLAIGLATSDTSVAAGPWKEYVWHVYKPDAEIQAAWDWKRPQFVTVTLKTAQNKVDIFVKLINRDPNDDDNVCVTMLFRDKSKRTIGVFHQNKHSKAGTEVTTKSSLSIKGAKSISSVAIGTKQCRGGPHQDDSVYEDAKVMLGQLSPSEFSHAPQ